jgi:hypothetical protein
LASSTSLTCGKRLARQLAAQHGHWNACGSGFSPQQAIIQLVLDPLEHFAAGCAFLIVTFIRLKPCNGYPQGVVAGHLHVVPSLAVRALRPSSLIRQIFSAHFPEHI